tara:strand:+ start:2217 stop:2702 length:486 start_codon:yes stop_codon:yes gene_type:complete
MVEIQNSKIVDSISEKVKESNLNLIPRQLANSVQAVIDVGRNIDQHFIESTKSTSSGSTTIVSTPTNKDFYLTSCSLGLIKDAASDNVAADLRATVNGTVEFLLQIVGITLTAQETHLTVSFPEPIKLDRGTAIKIQGTATAGNFHKTGTITGYTIDTLEK